MKISALNITCYTVTNDIYNLVGLTYGTARFKLEARVQVTRMYFVAPLEYFSKSCVSVENCTRISQAIHARMTSPNMLAYVRAWTHITIHAHSLRNFDRHQ